MRADNLSTDSTRERTAEAVQSMMDKLFPRLETEGFAGSEERKRRRAVLDKMISDGVQIDFNARIRECDEPSLIICRIAYASDPQQKSMVSRYALYFMERLGLSGSGFGNLPLPQEARRREGVDHWINWSQCYQRPGYPDNVISCEWAYHPLSQPSPGVKAVFETEGDKVLAIHFILSDVQEIRSIRSERRKLEKLRD